MNDIRFLYKCRLCGGIDDSLGIGGVTEGRVISLLFDAIFERESKEPQSPRLTTLHNCGPGRLGVADLIGSEDRKDKM